MLAGAIRVNRPCDEILSGPCLTENEDGLVYPSDSADFRQDFDHRLATADDERVVVLLVTV